MPPAPTWSRSTSEARACSRASRRTARERSTSRRAGASGSSSAPRRCGAASPALLLDVAPPRAFALLVRSHDRSELGRRRRGGDLFHSAIGGDQPARERCEPRAAARDAALGGERDRLVEAPLEILQQSPGAPVAHVELGGRPRERTTGRDLLQQGDLARTERAAPPEVDPEADVDARLRGHRGADYRFGVDLAGASVDDMSDRAYRPDARGREREP